jgi:hypothetical protein
MSVWLENIPSRFRTNRPKNYMEPTRSCVASVSFLSALRLACETCPRRCNDLPTCSSSYIECRLTSPLECYPEHRPSSAGHHRPPRRLYPAHADDPIPPTRPTLLTPPGLRRARLTPPTTLASSSPCVPHPASTICNKCDKHHHLQQARHRLDEMRGERTTMSLTCGSH